MMPSSRRIKLLALLLAGVAHAALAMGLTQGAAPIAVAEQGGAGVAEVRLGSAFADLAQGVMTATDSATALPVVQPAPAQPLHAVRDLSVTPVAPQALTPLQPLPAPMVQAAIPVLPQASAPPPPDRLAALPDPEPASAAPVTPSQRPQARPDPSPPRAEPAPRGNNATASATAGASSGREAATATTRGTGTAQAAGNAAAANYPGQVKRQVDRIRRPRMTGQGAVVVAFAIAGNGGLARAQVAQSSGDAALDQAALRIVQQAAPFPAPPAGARREYSIQIVWK